MQLILIWTGWLLGWWALLTIGLGAVLRDAGETTSTHFSLSRTHPDLTQQELDEISTPGQEDAQTGPNDPANQRPRLESRDRKRRELSESLEQTASPEKVAPGLERDTDDPQGVHYTLKQLRAMRPGPGVQHTGEMPAISQDIVQELRRRREQARPPDAVENRVDQGQPLLGEVNRLEDEINWRPNLGPSLYSPDTAQVAQATKVTKVNRHVTDPSPTITSSNRTPGITDGGRIVAAVTKNTVMPRDEAPMAQERAYNRFPGAEENVSQSQIAEEDRGEHSGVGGHAVNQASPQLSPNPPEITKGRLPTFADHAQGHAENQTQTWPSGGELRQAQDGQVTAMHEGLGTHMTTPPLISAGQERLPIGFGHSETEQLLNSHHGHVTESARQQLRTSSPSRRSRRSDLDPDIRETQRADARSDQAREEGKVSTGTLKEVKADQARPPTALEQLTTNLQQMKSELERNDQTRHLTERAAERDPDSAKKSLNKEIMNLMKEMESRPDNWLENELKLIEAESRSLKQKAAQLHHKLIRVSDEQQSPEPYMLGDGQRSQQRKYPAGNYPNHHIDMRVKIHRSDPRSATFYHVMPRPTEDYPHIQETYHTTKLQRNIQVRPMLERIEGDLDQLRYFLHGSSDGDVGFGYVKTGSTVREPRYVYPVPDMYFPPGTIVGRYKREKSNRNNTAGLARPLPGRSLRLVDKAGARRTRRAAQGDHTGHVESGEQDRYGQGGKYRHYIFQLRKKLSQRGHDTSRDQWNKKVDGESAAGTDWYRSTVAEHGRNQDSMPLHNQPFTVDQSRSRSDVVGDIEESGTNSKGNNSINSIDTSEHKVASPYVKVWPDHYGHESYKIAQYPANVDGFLQHSLPALPERVSSAYQNKNLEGRSPWPRFYWHSRDSKQRKPNSWPIRLQFPYGRQWRPESLSIPSPLRHLSHPSSLSVESVKLRLPSHPGVSNRTVTIHTRVRLHKLPYPQAGDTTVTIKPELPSVTARVGDGSDARQRFLYHPVRRNFTTPKANMLDQPEMPRPRGKQLPWQPPGLTEVERQLLDLLDSGSLDGSLSSTNQSTRGTTAKSPQMTRGPLHSEASLAGPAGQDIKWPQEQPYWKISPRQPAVPVNSFKKNQHRTAISFPSPTTSASQTLTAADRSGGASTDQSSLSISSKFRPTTTGVSELRHRNLLSPVGLERALLSAYFNVSAGQPTTLAENPLKPSAPPNTESASHQAVSHPSEGTPHQEMLNLQRMYQRFGQHGPGHPVNGGHLETDDFTFLPDEAYSKLIAQILSFPYDLFRRRRRRSSPWGQDQRGGTLREHEREQWPSSYYRDPVVRVPFGAFGKRRRRESSEQQLPDYEQLRHRLKRRNNHKAGLGTGDRVGQQGWQEAGREAENAIFQPFVRPRARRTNGAWRKKDPVSAEEKALKETFLQLLKDFPVSEAEHRLEEKMQQLAEAERISGDVGRAIVQMNKEPSVPYLDTEDAGDLFLTSHRSKPQRGRAGQRVGQPSRAVYRPDHSRFRPRRQVNERDSPLSNSASPGIKPEVQPPELSGMTSEMAMSGVTGAPITDALDDPGTPAYDYFQDDDNKEEDKKNYELQDSNTGSDYKIVNDQGLPVGGNYDDDGDNNEDDEEDNDDTVEDSTGEYSDDIIGRKENGIEVDDKGRKVEPKENFAFLEKDTNKRTDYTWGEWSTCSVSCGIGRRFRTNQCGGIPCTGAKASNEVEACSPTEVCPDSTLPQSVVPPGQEMNGDAPDGLSVDNQTTASQRDASQGLT